MEPKTGDVVISLAGRDKKRPLIVVATETNFVYLADGKNRPADRPKRKKTRHIMPTGHSDGNILGKLSAGARLTNGEIRRAIGAYHLARGEAEDDA